MTMFARILSAAVVGACLAPLGAVSVSAQTYFSRVVLSRSGTAASNPSEAWTCGAVRDNMNVTGANSTRLADASGPTEADAVASGARACGQARLRSCLLWTWSTTASETKVAVTGWADAADVRSSKVGDPSYRRVDCSPPA